MRVIDEKGRIGGKINIIDLLVILVILAALIAVAVVMGRGSAGGGEAEHIVYTVEVQGVDEDVYEAIQTKLPSQLLASDALQEAYVTKVEGTLVEENDPVRIDEAKDKNYIGLRPGEAGTYDLLFTIEATLYDTLSSKIGSQEIRVGRSHIVKTTTFELDYGIITSRETVEPEG